MIFLGRIWLGDLLSIVKRIPHLREVTSEEHANFGWYGRGWTFNNTNIMLYVWLDNFIDGGFLPRWCWFRVYREENGSVIRQMLTLSELLESNLPVEAIDELIFNIDVFSLKQGEISGS